MSVPDPSIDPITGLPVMIPSGPVQQIPLGQEVFPYADLNATAQPTRGPIYGDDIIPTSGLVTAPDKQMKPRSIQSTTTRELRVREAVFQNLGAAIPDGTTAPVDVNVVSGGGGGGGGPLVIAANGVVSGGGSLSAGAGYTRLTTQAGQNKVLAYLVASVGLATGALPAAEDEVISLFYVDNGVGDGPIVAGFRLNWDLGAPSSVPLQQTLHLPFPGGIDFTALLTPGLTYDFYTFGISVGFSIGVTAYFIR